MKCKKCGCDNINKDVVEKWDVACCPICVNDLKEQLNRKEIKNEPKN